MYLQVALLAERFPARRAHKWLLTCVDTLVVAPLRLLAESAITESAVIGFVPRVDPFVVSQVDLLVESLRAERAPEQIARVNATVIVQVNFLTECLPTSVTVIWFLSGVRPEMRPEVPLLTEHLWAVCALEGLFSSVHTLMVTQIDLQGESL